MQALAHDEKMNKYCECAAAGFCSRHQITKTPRTFDHCRGVSNLEDCGYKYWKAWEEGRLGATVPEEPQVALWDCKNDLEQVETKIYYTPNAGLNEGVGTEVAKILKMFRIKPVVGCKCNSLMAKMDAWGPEVCRENMDYIIEEMLKNSKRYYWAKFFPEMAKKEGIRGIVNKAIETVENVK